MLCFKKYREGRLCYFAPHPVPLRFIVPWLTAFDISRLIFPMCSEAISDRNNKIARTCLTFTLDYTDTNKKKQRYKTEANFVPNVSLPPVSAETGRIKILGTNFHRSLNNGNHISRHYFTLKLLNK